MHVLITGGAGFIGSFLAHRLANRGVLRGADGNEAPIEAITILDPAIPEPRTETEDGHVPVRYEPGSVCDVEKIQELVSHPSVSVFHFATLLPGRTEKDLPAALQVNVDGARNVLEALRTRAQQARFLSASTVALFTRSIDGVIHDHSAFNPTTIYGFTKSISEQLAGAYHLGAGLDVRSVRFPTVVIRPISVASSAGSALSDILRDVSLGRDATVKVHPETPILLSDYRTCVDGTIAVHDADAKLLGARRVVNFSGTLTTVDEMIREATKCAERAGRKPGRTRLEHSAFLQETMDKWPTEIHAGVAAAVGVKPSPSLEEICTTFLEDYKTFWLPRMK